MTSVFRGFLIAVTVLAAVAGAVINLHLTKKHTSKSTGPEWFAAACTPEDNPTYNCDAVLDTKWGVFDFKTFSFVEPDPDTGSQPGIPVSLVGLCYFMSLAVWFTFIGRPSYSRRWLHALPMLAVIGGCCGSIFFIVVMLTQLDEKCMWCLVSHGLNGILLCTTLLLWPRRPDRGQAEMRTADSSLAETTAPAAESQVAREGSGESSVSQIAPAEPPAVDNDAQPLRHPSARLVLMAILAIAFINYAMFAQAVADATAYRAKQFEAKLEEIYGDSETQMAQLQAEKRYPIEVRRDDPRRGELKFGLPLVIFSDFQCPACRNFSKQLEEDVRPLFDGLLQVVWKHYPIGTACNPFTSRNLHPHACDASYASEAVRLQGGDDAFWKFHDYVFDHPELFKQKQIDWKAIAKELGLDVDKFAEDMLSEDVKNRVADDIQEARKAQVKGTPSIFLEGRQVKQYMLRNKLLVERIVSAFKKIRDAKLARLEKAKEARKTAAEGAPTDTQPASDEESDSDSLRAEDEQARVPDHGTTPGSQDQPNAP